MTHLAVTFCGIHESHPGQANTMIHFLDERGQLWCMTPHDGGVWQKMGPPLPKEALSA